MIEIERFYLATLAKCAEADKYATVLQQVAPGAGRLWFIPERKPATTVPDYCLNFKFELDVVCFELEGRGNPVKAQKVVKYAEGLDGFIAEFMKALKANRLAAPKAA
jgi:hypothetical protein